MEIQTLNFIPRNWSDPILRPSEAKKLLAQPHHLLLSLGKNGEGGHLLARLVPETPADVVTLFVPEPYRRKGHALQLMRALFVASINAKCPSVTLEVAATNKSAVSLYTVLGLQQVAVRANYYPVSVSNPKGDALVLAVSLA